MSEITEYFVVDSESVEHLQSQVNKLIKEDGWKPIGGIQTNIWVHEGQVMATCYQAMVR